MGAAFFSFHIFLSRTSHKGGGAGEKQDLGTAGFARMHWTTGLACHLLAKFSSCGQAYLEAWRGRTENLLVSASCLFWKQSSYVAKAGFELTVLSNSAS